MRNAYLAYVNAGIALWGSSISCTEGGSSSMGTIKASGATSDATAITTIYWNETTKHISSWVITIYSSNFDNNVPAGKNRTIAHELGHVYGLGHFTNSNQIMYPNYSVTKNVTTYDKMGMKVMVHEHTHSGSYPTSLEKTTGLNHRVRCNTCKSYRWQTCSHQEYHAGARHYYDIYCSCGNVQHLSWACSGNPCVFPQ